ncbi:MAG: 4-hydroxythreonine-4-phosphate dehydrogenase PdxA [Gammaproteobacteria bacterium]|nr:MAG: 4-hydroxythreonine-4-phosphate dehydrogenase PdxA [Gammaproteobacteria bacterium]
MSTCKRIAITPGEPAGIGPDICLALAQKDYAHELIFITDISLLQQRCETLGLTKLHIHRADLSQTATPQRAGNVSVCHQPLLVESQCGQLNVANAAYVLACLNEAVDGCLNGRYNALVTGPAHKGIINDAGIPFQGHTEYLAEKTHTDLPVMMLAGGELRVALVTTHLPLSMVSEAITPTRLEQILRIVNHDLQQRFKLPAPRIGICGLNPHAGEGGHLGREEIEVISPVIEKLQKEGLNLTGPLPADTIFTPRHMKHYDAIVAMYHDQGLPVLKHHAFGDGVNITLGLPIIRTSVDHGTALDLAGTGKADSSSLHAALDMAITLTD